MSFHQTIIVGNVGRDPEIRYAPSGVAIANLSVAVSEEWKNKQGEQQESTEWYRCSAFNKTAELIGEYIHKGDPVMLIGRMKTRKWQDQSGSDRYSTELIVDKMNFIGGRSSGGSAPAQQDSHNESKSNGYQQQEPPPHDGGFDDDIPF